MYTMNILALHLSILGWQHEHNEADRQNGFIHYDIELGDWDSLSIAIIYNFTPYVVVRRLYPNKNIKLTYKDLKWT